MYHISELQYKKKMIALLDQIIEQWDTAYAVGVPLYSFHMDVRILAFNQLKEIGLIFRPLLSLNITI
ncbi:hypothetical protein GCM10010913_13160 [Paenibacillus aceti]|uniref:Uncharacterized protein n=1 Tax=Paenibacillus aceti TaxID=1820010 RepID=A0ABQ1VS92_9BACL|nr:hypothetical protein GCM10010913_13160 [Paenibacillus aceti]